MRARFMRELASLDLPAGPGSAAPITEADLAHLPDSVQRYLHFMGVVGRPRDWSFRLGWEGRFRRTPDEPWMACEAWQYNTRLELARIFHIRMRFGGLVPVLGRDTYRRGRGRMLVRLLDLVTVADGTGEEFDIGELVTYLNDGILLAPSMLLGPETTWSPVNGGSFDVTLRDSDRSVTARVFIDERGAPCDFSTTDRFYADPKEKKSRPVRARWTTPVTGWHLVDGRQLPGEGQAVWRFDSGPFAYVDFRLDPGRLVFDVPPGG